jgi:hypothetical protein
VQQDDGLSLAGLGHVQADSAGLDEAVPDAGDLGHV